MSLSSNSSNAQRETIGSPYGPGYQSYSHGPMPRSLPDRKPASQGLFWTVLANLSSDPAGPLLRRLAGGAAQARHHHAELKGVIFVL
jgi:hypothetical protein